MGIVSTVDEVLTRARSQIGLGIRYKLGGGAIRASRHTCADGAGACDCSAFACWALGIDKQGSYPFLVPAGQPVEPGNQWYGTDNIWNDSVHIALGVFSKIEEPVPGCLVLFPAQRASRTKATPGTWESSRRSAQEELSASSTAARATSGSTETPSRRRTTRSSEGRPA